jgi:cytochrome c-type biogenesis protein CcmH
MRRLLFALLLLAGTGIATPVLHAGLAAAAPMDGSFADPAQEARARNLQRQLRCLVCQGQSIDESNAPLAAELRALVRRQIAQGRSDDQIRDYLKARYGDFILMRPPLEQATWLLWLAPFLVLGGAGGVAWLAISRARKAAESLDSENISNL